MSQPSTYPLPPYPHPEHIDPHACTSLFASAWRLLEQPPPPTLREILNAYKSKGDGDRDMLLAMLNAKSAEDQRISAMATLHQKMLDAHASARPTSHDHLPPYGLSSGPSAFTHSPPLPRHSPTVSPKDVILPSIHTLPTSRKRARTSRSPPPIPRRHSAQGHHHQALTPSEQLPPSPPFSSPGRSALCSELSSHPQARDAMAIGSLLSSSHQYESNAEWPSRTSAERTGSTGAEREPYRQPKVSG